MTVVKQSFEILDVTSLALIEQAGRTCYKSEDKIDPLNEGEKFAQSMFKRGHMAMVEFAHMTVKFVTDRGVSHELVRHRLCSFAQESTRYCNYKGGVTFVEPSTWETWPAYAQDAWVAGMENAETRYIKLLEVGLTPQQARSVLPNSTKTEIVVGANLREWVHIFKLRCAKTAHPDMQALVTPLRDELINQVPWLKDYV